MDHQSSSAHDTGSPGRIQRAHSAPQSRPTSVPSERSERSSVHTSLHKSFQSSTRSTHESFQESIDEDGTYVSGTIQQIKSKFRRGTTRIPKQFIQRETLIHLGYPFHDREDHFVLSVPLGKEHLDEVLRVNQTFATEEFVDQGYEIETLTRFSSAEYEEYLAENQASPSIPSSRSGNVEFDGRGHNPSIETSNSNQRGASSSSLHPETPPMQEPDQSSRPSRSDTAPSASGDGTEADGVLHYFPRNSTFRTRPASTGESEPSTEASASTGRGRRRFSAQYHIQGDSDQRPKLTYRKRVERFLDLFPQLEIMQSNYCRAPNAGNVVCYDYHLNLSLPVLNSHLSASAWTGSQISEEFAALSKIRNPRIKTRVVLVEDLSPSLIDALGSTFDIDPKQ